MQALDPRVKLVGVLLLVSVAAASRELWVVGAIFLVAVALALASDISPGDLANRVWLPGLLFTGALALPALFLVPGRELGLGVSEQGLRSAAFLLGRVLASATLVLTLVAATSWTHVLKALRVLRVPAVLVVILGMTYRYIFLMLQVALDMFESRRSRTVGSLSGAERRRIATSGMGVLLDKSFQLSSEVYLAMQSRGFRGDAYTLDEFAMRRRDWLALVLFAAGGALGLWLGL